jgi:hypothetical protein
MEGLLDLMEGNRGTDRPAEQAPAANTDEGETVEAEPQETTGTDTPAGEAETTDVTDGTAEPPSEEPQMVTVTIDGKTQTIPLDEAARGYQRHADYSRKTADLANQRRTLEEQSKAVQEERQTYAIMLEALRGQLTTGQEAEPNWDQVYAADPVGYARRRDEWRDRQEKIAAASFEQQRVQSLQQKQNAENLARMASDNRVKMLDLEPAWKDPQVWDTVRPRLVAYAQSIGYSTEEISNAYDPRAIVMMNKARLWDEQMHKGKPTPVPRNGPRVASAGAAPDQSNAPRLNAAQQRLAKSGRIEDAAKVFEQLLG